MAKSSISIFHRPIPSRPSSLLTQMFCPYIQCLQSSRSHVGGSNLDFCVEEKFQMTLNPWTGRSQLLPETFKFELRPVWWGAGTERHSPPSSSSLAGGILILSAGFVLFSTVVFLGDLEIYFFKGSPTRAIRTNFPFEAIHFPPTGATQKAPPSDQWTPRCVLRFSL